MSTPYTVPVTYRLPIDELDKQVVTFRLGITESRTGHVAWTMPRDEWERHGRPAEIELTVGSWPA